MEYIPIILLIISCYFNFNLLKKQEIYEEALANKTDDIDAIILHYSTILQKIKEIDNKKLFESDDEVGVTFEMLKNAIEEGKEYLIKYYNDDIGTTNNSR
jgi:hypothetical protein